MSGDDKAEMQSQLTRLTAVVEVARAVVEYYVSPTGHCFACDGAEHKHWERCRIGKLATAVQAIEEGRDDLRGIVEAWCMRQYKALLPGDALKDLIAALDAHVAARVSSKEDQRQVFEDQLNDKLEQLRNLQSRLATVTAERDGFEALAGAAVRERDQARADLAAAVAAEREACARTVCAFCDRPELWQPAQALKRGGQLLHCIVPGTHPGIADRQPCFAAAIRQRGA